MDTKQAVVGRIRRQGGRLIFDMACRFLVSFAYPKIYLF